MIKKSFYHQIENTNQCEFSTFVYDHNAREIGSPHFHKNFEILAVQRGECRYTIGDSTYILHAGEAIFTLPFQVHSFSVEEGSEVRCVTFCDLLILTLAKHLKGKKLLSPVFTPSAGTWRFFSDSMDEMFGRSSGYILQVPQARRMRLKGCLYTIGGEALEKTEPVSVGGADMVVLAVVDYIAENFKANISLRDVAEAKGYNYQYLSRIFNHTFGVNFKTMLNQYRTDYALELLRDSDLSLTEIAFESGFQSVRSFDHVFRESLGCSPKEFRKEK